MERRVPRNWFLHARRGDSLARRAKNLEDNEDVFWYFAEVLNPLSYLDSVILDPTTEKISAKGEHAAVAAGLFGIPVYATWLLSGGGATPVAARGARPGMLAMYAAKQHIQKTVLVGATRAVRKSLPVALVTGMYLGVRGYYHHLASLDWVPDLYTI